MHQGTWSRHDAAERWYLHSPRLSHEAHAVRLHCMAALHPLALELLLCGDQRRGAHPSKLLATRRAVCAGSPTPSPPKALAVRSQHRKARECSIPAGHKSNVPTVLVAAHRSTDAAIESVEGALLPCAGASAQQVGRHASPRLPYARLRLLDRRDTPQEAVASHETGCNISPRSHRVEMSRR